LPLAPLLLRLLQQQTPYPQLFASPCLRLVPCLLLLPLLLPWQPYP
jgi:hypothetical protein